MAFDETDDTVIVVDAMDIYKVPKELKTTDTDSSAFRTSDTNKEDSKKDVTKAQITEESNDDQGCRSDPPENSLREDPLKYIHQSQSLLNLRSKASVRRGIKNFDHS